MLFKNTLIIENVDGSREPLIILAYRATAFGNTALVWLVDRKVEPFVIVRDLSTDGYWSSGKYYDDLSQAEEAFNGRQVIITKVTVYDDQSKELLSQTFVDEDGNVKSIVKDGLVVDVK